MGNQQESLQYKIFMEGVVLDNLKLHKVHTISNEDKINFIKSYLTMPAPYQYKYLGLGRGAVTLMRQKLIAYISTLNIPNGFTEIPINSIEKFLINKEGIVIRKNDRQIIKPMLDTSGYYRVSIIHTRPNGTLINYERTHRLMGFTYLENPNEKRTINHIDGNKLNNCLSNLEWATDAENTQHAHDTGLSPKQNGPRYDRRKFTNEIMNEIRDFGTEVSTASLARRYNLSEAIVRNIRYKKHKD